MPFSMMKNLFDTADII